MHLFYTPDISGQVHVLDPKESKHAVQVLRLRQGDRVAAVDGSGGWYDGMVREADPKRCILEITGQKGSHLPMPVNLHLAISPTKRTDRFEWFLEKATEIGISEITPLVCHRSERRSLRHERLDRVAVSAMKQSLRAYKPVIHGASTLESFLRRSHRGTLGIAHCVPSGRAAFGELPRGDAYTFLIGPEGDFTPEEVEQAVNAGFIPFHLGSARLRTETAGVHLVSAVNLRHAGPAG